MAYRGSGFGFGFSLTPWVKRLLIANIGVFVLLGLIPQVQGYLALVPRVVMYTPWTPFTYMFVHAGFMHILFNMLLLFFFGPPIEGRLGSRRFLQLYLICGFAGAALSFVFAYDSIVVGASAAVLGVMVAFALFWPDSPIYIWGILPIPAKWLVTGLVFLDLWGMILNSPGDRTAHFAHLGGVAAAFLYIRWLQKNRWTGDTYRAAGKKSGGGGGLAGLKEKLRRKDHVTLAGGGRPAARPQAPRPRREEEEKILDEVDRVLDKISSQGIASLTADERKLLDEVSRRYRSN